MSYANCNWWQYSRWIVNVSRTVRYWGFTTAERTAALAFITAEQTIRSWLASRIRMKFCNTKTLAQQPDFVLAKIIGVIGRDLKVVAPTDAEKTNCDALMTATGTRKLRYYTALEESDSDSSDSSSSAEN